MLAVFPYVFHPFSFHRWGASGVRYCCGEGHGHTVLLLGYWLTALGRACFAFFHSPRKSNCRGLGTCHPDCIAPPSAELRSSSRESSRTSFSSAAVNARRLERASALRRVSPRRGNLARVKV